MQQETGQHPAPVPLANVIRDVCLPLSPQVQALGAQVLVALKGFPAFPFAEKNLRSVVYNLLSNALKYHYPDRVPLVLSALPLPNTLLSAKNSGGCRRPHRGAE